HREVADLAGDERRIELGRRAVGVPDPGPHLLARRRRATALQAAGDPGSDQRAAPELDAGAGRRSERRPVLHRCGHQGGRVLELSQLARDTGIRFDSISPQPPAAVGSYTVLPISVTFNGNFYNLADFLYRLRSLVSVHAGRLDATGRLFAVDTLTFNESALKFPQIQATLVVDAFVYSAGAPAPAPAPAATPPVAGTTTATTPTAATTTTTPPDT